MNFWLYGNILIKTNLILSKKVKDHDAILQTNAEYMENLSSSVKEIAGNQKESNQDKVNTSNRIDSLATAHAKTTKDLQKEIEGLKVRMSNQTAEITSLKNGQRVATFQTETVNRDNLIHDPQAQSSLSRLNMIIEGLKETENEDLLSKAILLFDKIGVNVP